MVDEQRRIRRLSLRGADETALRHARRGLEEAFRTASLPGLPPQAQVVIRRLDLGEVPNDASAGLLARRIDARVQQLAASAVRVDGPDPRQPAADAEVVWFADTLQSYALLLARLLDGAPATAWYWRSLFPPQALGPEGVDYLLLAAVDTPAGAHAPAHLLAAVLQPARVPALLARIEPALAERLLHHQGQLPMLRSPGPDGPTPLPPPPCRPVWRTLLRQAAERWGTQDVRSRWLALQALIRHRPGLLARRDSAQRIRLDGWLEEWSADAGQVAVDKASVVRRGTTETSVPGRARALAEGERAAAAAPQEAAPQTKADRTPRLSPTGTVVKKPGDSVDAPTDPGTTGAGAEAATAPRLTPAAPLPASEDESRASASTRAPATPWDDLQPSTHAGFALLIRLFERLDMAALLAENEALLLADFPLRVLRDLACRLGLPRDDGVWRLFDELDRTAPVVTRFVAPEGWWRLAAEDGRPLRRGRLDAAGRCLIAAPNGRYCLFYGAADDPACVLRMQDRTVEDTNAPSAPLRVQTLSAQFRWLCAARLRRLSGISLRRLVCRPGKLALTATHWDVIFDLAQTDLRLRRVALDCDPGWVPWLGRVVQIHYREGA